MGTWIVWSGTSGIRIYDPLDKICDFINIAIEQSIKAEEERRRMLRGKKLNKEEK